LFSKITSNSCKKFNKLTEERLVFQRLNLYNHYHHPQVLQDQAKKLIARCYFAGNPQAKYMLGSSAYFHQGQRSIGKAMLAEAAEAGDIDGTYSYGIALLCESNTEGIARLLHVLDDEHGKHRIRICRMHLQALTFGSAIYEMPNIQACNKIGNGHWNRDGPYPFGLKEFVITCRKCSIDLEMYQIVKEFI
jgi:hypothetical protein